MKKRYMGLLVLGALITATIVLIVILARGASKASKALGDGACYTVDSEGGQECIASTQANCKGRYFDNFDDCQAHMDN